MRVIIALVFIAILSALAPRQYLSFLRSPTARSIFEAHGFAFLPK